MGEAVPSLDVPVVKVTSGLLAFCGGEAILPAPSACIKCGRCAAHCPMNLPPSQIEDAYELKKPELLKKYKVNLCVGCGCCAYVCPAKRPLAQVMALSDGMLREAADK